MSRRMVPVLWIVGVAVTAGAAAGLSGEPKAPVRQSPRGRAEALASARDRLLEAADLLVDASNAGPSDSLGSKALHLSSDVGHLLDRAAKLCDDARRGRPAEAIGPLWDGVNQPDRRWQVREAIPGKPAPLTLPPVYSEQP